MKIPLIILAVILACWLNAGSAIAGDDKDPDSSKPKNYCHDEASWKEWDALVKKYPDDMDIQTLDALRLGLCIKIDKGSIKLKDAIDIFDHAHEEVIRRATERDKERPPAM
jgi:hypothetical protein